MAVLIGPEASAFADWNNTVAASAQPKAMDDMPPAGNVRINSGETVTSDAEVGGGEVLVGKAVDEPDKEKPRKKTGAAGHEAVPSNTTRPISGDRGKGEKKRVFCERITEASGSVLIDCTDSPGKEAKEPHAKGYTILTEPESLIVLPFKNASGDKELDWLSMGLWDVLSVKLGYVQGFKALGIRDYITEAGRSPGELALYGFDEAMGLARALSAGQVWTGEVKKDAEGNIEINMKGVHVKSGKEVFSKKLKSSLEKLPLMINGLLEAILAELEAELGKGVLSKMRSKYVGANKAWEYNARGYEKLLLASLSGDREKRDGLLEESTGLLRTSVEEGPRYASGWCNLGWALLAKGDVPAAKEAFKKSLKIKPFFIEANMGMGYALWEENNVGEAVLYMREAINQNPAVDWNREEMKRTVMGLKYRGGIRKSGNHMNMNGIRVVSP